MSRPTEQTAPPPGAAGGTAPLARTAFVIALIAFAIEPVWAILTGVIRPARVDPALVAVERWGDIVLTLIVGTAAFALGLLAIREPGSHTRAGIAIGVAATSILITILATIYELRFLTSGAS